MKMNECENNNNINKKENRNVNSVNYAPSLVFLSKTHKTGCQEVFIFVSKELGGGGYIMLDRSSREYIYAKRETVIAEKKTWA